MKDLLLGIDIGTSACKAALFSEDGKVIAQTSEAYPVYYPQPGWVEQDPREWWQAVCRAVRNLLEQSQIRPERIAGIGVDGQSWSAIPVDGEGNCLSNTPIWMDTRAREICEEVQERGLEPLIFSVSGNGFSPSYTTPKMMWLKENRPEIYEKTACVLQSNSFIVLKLTGVFSQDVSQGYGLHFFRQETRTCDSDLAAQLGLSASMVPEPVACHQIVGTVTWQAAKETGLISGIPVCAGGLDAACGSLGAGVLRPGQTQEQGGQAGGMSICEDVPKSHKSLILSPHVIPGQWLLQGGTVGGGGILRWMKRELAPDLDFDEITSLADTVPAGSGGVLFLPYMAGERSPIWNPDARGVFYGLGYEKGLAHMLRAGLESVAFSLEHNLRCAGEAGVAVNELFAMGGAANSRMWTQMKADVTGRTICVPASDTATTLGAVILAGVGVGLYPDFETAVKKTVRIQRVHQPDWERHRVYEKQMERYLILSESMQRVYEKLENGGTES